MPPHFVHHLRNLALAQVWPIEVYRRHFLTHLAKWRRNPQTYLPLPGYTTPPPNSPHLPHPHGWSRSNFERIAKAARLHQSHHSSKSHPINLAKS